MSEIWNLSALCRCCHSDGEFKSLKRSYVVNNDVEIYSSMLRDTFGIIIDPPKDSADISYTICDKCIQELRKATNFKKQVLICESKFEEYCKNEESLKFNCDVKMEVDTASDSDDSKEASYAELEIKDEYNIDVKCGISDIKDEDKTANKITEVPIVIEKLKTESDKPKKSKKLQLKPRGDLTDEHLKLIQRKGDVFSCRKCSRKFKKIYTIKTHILHKHAGKPYKCKVCNQEFKRQNEKLAHMPTHDPNLSFQCTYTHCRKVFPTKRALKSHLNTHTKNAIYECDYCKKKFYYKKSVLIHIKLLHLKLPKPLMCDVCGKSFNDVTNLRLHVQTIHEKIRPFKCEMCTKDFTAKKHLVVHIRRDHTGERPFECDLCTEAFVCLFDLVKHKEKIHEGKITTYKCKLCNLEFPSRGGLVKHSKSHAGSKPLICNICGKDFACKYSLRRHQDSHSGVKKYQCTVCSNKFIQKGGLNRHMERAHNDTVVEKKKCDICKKHVTNLEKHIDAHNNKPHGCDFCPKRYPERNALNRHIANIHFGRKAHACDLCDQKYVHPKSLRNHKLKVHKILTEVQKEEVLDDYLTTYMIENKKAGGSSVDVKIDD